MTTKDEFVMSDVLLEMIWPIQNVTQRNGRPSFLFINITRVHVQQQLCCWLLVGLQRRVFLLMLQFARLTSQSQHGRAACSSLLLLERSQRKFLLLCRCPSLLHSSDTVGPPDISNLTTRQASLYLLVCLLEGIKFCPCPQ